jgi:hypothetical protein
MPAGAEVKLQRDAQDDAAFYVIDLVDFEQVAPPAEMPAGFTSVSDFGAIPDDNQDDADRIATALGTVQKLWFPPGRYQINQISSGNVGLDNPGIEVRGAGMWHTLLEGRQASFFCVGANASCKFGDFSLFGETKALLAGPGVQKGFAGAMGKDSLIENVWIEHQIAGIWAGADPPYQERPTEHLTIRNVRVRNVYGAGISLPNGASSSLVENSHVRNSGDDSFVVWPIKWSDWVKERAYEAGSSAAIPEPSRAQPDQGVGHGNTFRNVTAQMPWRTHCFASYGGHGNTFENGVCEDVLASAGLSIANARSSYGFGPQPTVFRAISLLRAGGTESANAAGMLGERGALQLYLREGAISDVSIESVDIIDAAHSGIEFRGFGTAFVAPGERIHPDVLAEADAATLNRVSLSNVNVTGACGYGVQVSEGGGHGRVSFENVSVERARLGGREALGTAPGFFDMQQGNRGF